MSKWVCRPAPNPGGKEAAIQWAKADLSNHYWTVRDGVPYVCWRDDSAPGLYAVEEEPDSQNRN